MEEDINILEKFTKIVKGKDYNAENGWHGYYDIELMALGKSIENLIAGCKELEEENKKLKKYDIRNIKIGDDKILKSPSFTKEEIDLMNLGIALSTSFDVLFNDEREE